MNSGADTAAFLSSLEKFCWLLGIFFVLAQMNFVSHLVAQMESGGCPDRL